MNIGEKIRFLRIAKDLTQEELALAAGTTKQTIHKYETGIISNIPASKIKALADRLDTTPAYLMGWEETGKTADKNLSEMSAQEILNYAEKKSETTYDILGYDGKKRTRTSLTKDEYEKVMGILDLLRKDK